MREADQQILSNVRRHKMSFQGPKKTITRLYCGRGINEFGANRPWGHVTTSGFYQRTEADSITTKWEISRVTKLINKSFVSVPQLQNPRGMPTLARFGAR